MTQPEHLPQHSSERQPKHLPPNSGPQPNLGGYEPQPELETIPNKPPLNLIRGILTAYAVGDAMGMPTEFMTRAERRHRAGLRSFRRIFERGFYRSIYHS